MNYNYDTEMEREWAADQLRRSKNEVSGVLDTPVRRATASLRDSHARDGYSCGITAPGAGATLGCALSALAINLDSAEACRQNCEELLGHVAERDRVALHQEFVELKGIEAVAEVVRRHPGPAALMALRILDKLSRTSAREICAANAVETVVKVVEVDEQAPRMLEAALRVLHGLTFDEQAKLLLLRRGVRGLAEAIEEAGPRRPDPEDEERSAERTWQDVMSICTRLVQRLSSDRGPVKATRGDAYAAARRG